MANTDTGYFKMTNVPAGTYTVRFSDNNFTDTQIQNIIVKSGDTTNIGTIKMYLSGTGNPPVPLELKSAFDTSSGIVTLGWDSVPIPDFKNFLVIRKDSNSVRGLFRIDSTYTAIASLMDTVLFTDTLGYSVSYSVQCFDNSGHFSDPSQSITINAKPPTGKTTVTLSKIDSAGLFDVISETATYTNPSALVKKLIWTKANGDTIQVKDSVFKSTGVDMLKTSWNDTGRHAVYFITIDNLGRTSKDSTFVTVVQDKPVINYLSPNQTIKFGGVVLCSLAVSHRFGTCSLRVYQGNSLINIKRSYNTATIVFDTSFSTGTSSAWDSVIIMIADSHGNSIRSGFSITILPPPMHDQWVTLSATMNYHHRSHCSEVLNGSLYAIGGCMAQLTGTGQPKPYGTVRGVEAFDSAQKVWVKKDSLIYGRYNFMTCVFNGKIYAVGGTGSDSGYAKTIEQYDPIADTWTVFDLMRMGTTAFTRMSSASCLVGNKLYLFGGITGNDSACQSVYTYNLISKAWSEIKPGMHVPRSNFKAIPMGSKIYLIGGETDADGYYLNSTEIFDTLKQTFVTGSNLPNSPAYFSASVVGKKLYLIGGADFENGQVFNSVYMLDTISQTSWQPVSGLLPDPRHSMSSAVINGNIYLTGGITTPSPVFGETTDQNLLIYYP
jgi:hypothetical protein